MDYDNKNRVLVCGLAMHVDPSRHELWLAAKRRPVFNTPVPLEKWRLVVDPGSAACILQHGCSDIVVVMLRRLGLLSFGRTTRYTVRETHEAETTGSERSVQSAGIFTMIPVG